MFTGLVQALGKVTALTKGHDSMVLTFNAGELADGIAVGDSVAVNGVCLTATKVANQEIDVDIMFQTLRLTNFKNLTTSDLLNLELAMHAVDRLGGHLVQGHVDGMGEVLSRQMEEKWERLDVGVPPDLMKYIVAQGSICLNGVSLTVGAIDDESNSITLWLIPETLAKTNLREYSVGDLLNIEVDILAKYVERLLVKSDS